MQNDHGLKKLKLDFLTQPQGQWVGSAATFLDSLLFDLQYDHFLKKLTLDRLTPSRRVRGLGGLQQKFVIPFYLICNMTMF